MTDTTKTTTATPTCMWLVVEGRWEVDGFPGVFSTEELAESYMEKANRDAERFAALHNLHSPQIFAMWELPVNPVFSTNLDEPKDTPTDEHTGGDDA